MIKGSIKTEKQYFATELDSSSSLKEFSLDRRKYKKKYIDREKVEEEEERSKAATIGTVVETLLFQKEEFDNRFYMSSLSSAPTGLMLAFVEALYKHSRDNTDENGNITQEFSELAKLAYKDSGFKISFEAVLNKFIGSDAEIFYKEIREIRSKGLVVITSEDVSNAERIVEELRSNEVTAPILNLVNSDRYTILIQYQIENYEIDGLPLKSMMDLVVIDHKEKTIQVFDLKCSWSVEGFYEEYYLYRRAYIQAYLYREACKEIKIREKLDHYTVLYPKFIVADSINYMFPLIYSLNTDDIQDAYNGFTYKSKYYPGIKDIILDLRFAKEKNIWKISRENYLSNGIVSLKNKYV
jgi:hypothetical protein